MIRRCLFSSIAGLVALVAIAGLTPQVKAQQLPPGQQAQGGEPRYRDGEVLVKFRANVTDAEIATAFRGAGLQMLRHILTGPMKANGEIGITHALTAMPVEQAVELLNRLPGIEYAQPNWIYTHQEVQPVNDPYFTRGDLWGMGTGFGSGASTTWNTGVVGSKDVYIGVIDEGIQYNHPDLAGNMWINTGEGSVANGVDDDGNGFIDDFYGWNGLGDNGIIYDANYDDHGTHVSGTIGATGWNNQGVIGVSPEVKLISGKFLGPNGGATSDAIQVIDYMTRLKTERAVNIVALNNSWGGGGYDPALLDSIVRAAKADILFVAASGNGDSRGIAINTDASPNYPSCYNTLTLAGYDSIIAVTSIASDGTKAGSANYGATTVDLGAPGVNINSTLPGSSYGAYSGTSMATPHVTGAIALYAARYPGAKAVDIKQALMSSTEVTTSLGGKTVTGGRLNVPNFLSIVPPNWMEPVYTVAPTAPTFFVTTATSFNSVSLSWVDNSNNETSFVLTRTLDGVPTDIVIPANMESYTDTKLAANTSYTYELKACNSIGKTAAATPITVTTPQAPAPATAVFVSNDIGSKGNWLGNYGLDGYDILRYPQMLSYATVAFSSYAPHTWASATTDSRALRTPSGSSRFASCNYSTTSLTIDVNINDQVEHTVSLYCVDYDRKGRVQTIQIWYPNFPTTPLDQQTISGFGEGIYLTWKITGSVIIKIIYAGGTQNAVVSGVFLDPNLLPAPTGLTAKAASGRIDLSWTYSSPDATGFSIERSSSATTGFARIGDVAKDKRQYTDAGLTRNTTYYYRVRANPNGKYSNTAFAKTPAK